jgi:CHAD domain-containing protein
VITARFPVVAPAPRAAARAADHLLRLREALVAAAERVRAGNDPEAIHDLRVAARRLGAVLEVWRHALDPRGERGARRGLRRLRRRLARAREREVLAGHLLACLDGQPLAVRRAGMIEWERLGRQVERDRARAARIAARGRVARIARRLATCASSLRQADATALEAARDRALTRRAAALATLHLATPEAADAALHRARVAVKRWRYAFEALEAADLESDGGVISALRDLQRCLGEVHDAAVLRDHLARRSRRAFAKARSDRAEALILLQQRAVEARRRALAPLASACAAAGVRPLS